MSRLLIKVKRRPWDRSQRPEHVAGDDVPADCLTDLRVRDNELSLWHIEDDEKNLNGVVTALASAVHFPAKIDILLFDTSIIQNLSLKLRSTVGKTPRTDINTWHRDLVELSGKKLVEFAIAVFYGAESRRVPEISILSLLRNSYNAGLLDKSMLKPSMTERIRS